VATKSAGFLGAIYALICASCFLLGVVTLKWLAPDIYHFPDGRLRVIMEYGWWLHLWHFIVFPLLGLCVFLLNRVLTRQNRYKFEGLAVLCTIVSFLTLSHDTTIFIVEIMSNELLIRQEFDSNYEQAKLTLEVYAILNKLRASTEWGIDLWLCLISVLLFLRGRFHVLLHTFGFSVGVLGILVLNDAFHHLSFVYLYAMIVWFGITGMGLMLEAEKKFNSAH
jgi:Ca2+/Na+ antiporter